MRISQIPVIVKHFLTGFVLYALFIMPHHLGGMTWAMQTDRCLLCRETLFEKMRWSCQSRKEAEKVSTNQVGKKSMSCRCRTHKLWTILYETNEKAIWTCTFFRIPAELAKNPSHRGGGKDNSKDNSPIIVLE